MRFLAALFLALLVAAPAHSAIGPEHKTCAGDQDCALVLVRCTECCPTPADFDAVNTRYQKQDQDLGVCTPEHIKSCGVPECGLFTPEPYPVAVCREGVCAVKAHPPDPRPPAPLSAGTTDDSAKDRIYGTDRDSTEQHELCELETGQGCIFDMCQVTAGSVPADYHCEPGWKPAY
jgi:hypothetical protein